MVGDELGSGAAWFGIRSEGPRDVAAVRRVCEAAFGGDARIAPLVDALRVAAGTISLTAVADDGVVGHVMLSAARLDAPRRLVDVLVLSPLSVLPAWQRRGVGTRLVAAALDAARAAGAPLVFLEGSPDYYGRRGFRGAEELGFRSPSPRIPQAAFQVAPLDGYEPWMTGTFVYRDVFWALDCVGLRDQADPS
ncbi:GNAT family N-acetyltransferase [Yinghuangia seranimata]|uniref:GNAT family N-acetyltransferase n=1 Tax=Yinghuangia seranimata TaxID=408067 RepID=UPI00248C1855|nr:N-acetyltransferase [Yinghuangia seranimata]MDI2130618.1 N-acetyltransferase [Yinghuangia seranimata]